MRKIDEDIILEEIYQRTLGLGPQGENIIGVLKEYREKFGYKPQARNEVPDNFTWEISEKFILYVAKRKSNNGNGRGLI